MNNEGCTVNIALRRRYGRKVEHKTIPLVLTVPWGDPGVAEAVRAYTSTFAPGWTVTAWAPVRPQIELMVHGETRRKYSHG